MTDAIQKGKQLPDYLEVYKTMSDKPQNKLKRQGEDQRDKTMANHKLIAEMRRRYIV